MLVLASILFIQDLELLCNGSPAALNSTKRNGSFDPIRIVSMNMTNLCFAKFQTTNVYSNNKCYANIFKILDFFVLF